MTKPVTIPNTFATATTAIPLSNLDADFSTVATALNDANTYSNYAPDTGSANAYVVTLSGVSTTYSAGLRIQFKAGNANTTASTLNVNGGGAKNITYQDATAIASGTIAANSIVDVMYDGTQFLLMNDPAGATGGDVVGPSSATDNAIVRFDGTTGKLVQNSVVTIADSTGDISGVGQLNATTVDATNIEVTNIKAKDGTAAASIADSTGVISITSNPVLSGGTANGVLYLNGSKVATSGSALVFDGTNLGIGTSSPAYKLDVSGSANITSFLRIGTTPATGGDIRLPNTGIIAGRNAANSTNRVMLQLDSSDSVLLQEGSVTINSSGNLGLGVTPSGWGASWKALELPNGVAIASAFGIDYQTVNAYHNGTNFIYKTSSVASYYQNGPGAHAWHIAPSGTAGNAITFTQALTLDASGNLGIGTSSPGAKLAVSNGTQTGIINPRSSASGGLAIGTDIASTGYVLNLAGDLNGGGTGGGVNIAYYSSVSSTWNAALSIRNTASAYSNLLLMQDGGNVGIGGSAARSTTVGSAIFNIFNGTAPVGTLTNGISLYSSSGEAYVMDAAGNATLFSPHDRDTNEWIFRSKHTPSGKVLKIDVERLLRFVNDHFGLDAVQEFIEP